MKTIMRMGAAGLLVAAAALQVGSGTASAAAASCALGAPQPYVGEWPNASPGLAPSVGRLDMIVVFVDFPDAPAGTESAQALYDKVVAPAVPYYQSVSGGRLDLQPHALPVFLRMPHPSTSYGFPDLTAEQHLAFFKDALAKADPLVNFSGQEVFDVIPTQAAKAINTSVSLDAGPVRSYFAADGATVRFGSSFGGNLGDPDADDPFRVAPTIFEHETGHVLGLPDLYATDSQPDNDRYVGSWDPMGNNYRGTGFNAWHRFKLGWLDPTQVTCLTKPTSVTTTLTPLDAAGGRKLLAIKYSSKRAYTVEVRRPQGVDAGLCGSGVLISRIDAAKASGEGPVVVARAARSTSTDPDCGSTANAPYQAGSSFRSGRVTVNVLSGSPNTGYKVSATFAPAASSARPKPHKHKHKHHPKGY